MPELIYRILVALWENDISRIFSVAILAYLAFALLAINAQSAKIRSLVDNAPGAMTSLGILGTFVGIFVGLLDFDIRTINQSVPTLLEGLKVAFGTSILGLASAVGFRLVGPVLRRSTISESAGIEDIVESLKKLEATATELNGTSASGFENLRKALTDDADSSIVGQIQRMRASLGDLNKTTSQGFEEQIREFRTFSETMSEAFSKAIIDELKNVIREFNEKISEQFGDNFRQLNEAVGRLLTWQEEYRQQMSAMKDALDKATISVQANRASLEKIASSASMIPEHMKNLEQIMQNLARQIEEIEGGLHTFAEIKDKAINAFPDIEKNIQNLTQNMSDAVGQQTENIRNIQVKCEEVLEFQKQGSDYLIEEFGKLQNVTAENATKMTTALTDSIGEQKIAQDRLMDELQRSFNETVSETQSRLNETIKQLDEAMEEEIGKCVKVMADNLSGITEKFVEDYQPLLEATRAFMEAHARKGPRDE